MESKEIMAYLGEQYNQMKKSVPSSSPPPLSRDKRSLLEIIALQGNQKFCS